MFVLLYVDSACAEAHFTGTKPMFPQTPIITAGPHLSIFETWSALAHISLLVIDSWIRGNPDPTTSIYTSFQHACPNTIKANCAPSADTILQVADIPIPRKWCQDGKSHIWQVKHTETHLELSQHPLL